MHRRPRQLWKSFGKAWERVAKARHLIQSTSRRLENVMKAMIFPYPEQEKKLVMIPRKRLKTGQISWMVAALVSLTPYTCGFAFLQIQPCSVSTQSPNKGNLCWGIGQNIAPLGDGLGGWRPMGRGKPRVSVFCLSWGWEDIGNPDGASILVHRKSCVIVLGWLN